MIRILEISGEPVGGVRKHVHSILKNIDKNEFKIYYSYSNINKDATFDKEIYLIKLHKDELLELKIFKKPSFSDFVNIYKLIKFVKTNDIQIVHGHGAKGGMYARVIKLFTNIKSIYTPHGGILHNSFGKVSEFIYKTVEKILVPLTDIVVVESVYSKNKYIEKIKDIQEKLILNYNGVSYNEPENKIVIPNSLLVNKKDQQINLAVFARFHDMKRQDIAIKALKHLSDKYVLHLFGNGEKKEYLQYLVKSLDLNERVFFHGDVSYPEEMMKYVDVIIIPSYFESFSYVAAEGLMMKKLVIANKTGGLKEVLDHNSGILIENMNEYNLSDVIDKLYYEKYLSIVSNGYERYIKYFQEKRMIKNLEIIYKDELK